MNYEDLIAREEFDTLFASFEQEGVRGYEIYANRYALEYHEYTGTQRDTFKRQLNTFVHRLKNAGKQTKSLPAVPNYVLMIDTGNYYGLFQGFDSYPIPPQYIQKYNELRQEYIGGQNLDFKFADRLKTFVQMVLHHGRSNG